MTSGDKVGVFCCQHGPGIENSFGAIAQAYSEGVPLVVVAGGTTRGQHYMKPYFSASLNFRHVTKQRRNDQHARDARARDAARVQHRAQRPARAVPRRSAGRHVDCGGAGRPSSTAPRGACLSAPDPQSVDAAAEALIAARMPLLYAGQGVHYAKAWPELKQIAELLEAPVTTSLEGKSAFPENHPLSLGSGGRTLPRAVATHVAEADVVFGIGASFTPTNYGIRFPTDGQDVHPQHGRCHRRRQERSRPSTR